MAELPFRITVRDDGTVVVNRFGGAVERTSKRTVKAAAGMTAAFAGLRAGINTLPSAIFNLRTAVVGFAAVASVRIFTGFEKGLNRVRALTGATGQSFQQLEDQARRLGETTQFTARQSADAMAFLAQAGFEADEIIQALPATLELAASAALDLARSADIVTNILTGLRLPIDDLGRANDVLVKAFTSTNVNLSQLGESFKTVGPIATSAGISFEELTATIGLLGNAGIQGSLAGTALRNVISRLLVPSKATAAVIKTLGLNVVTATGGITSLTDIIRQLEEAGADTTQVMQIFGLRAGPAVAALLGQGSEALVEFTEDLRDSGGIAARVAEIQLSGLSGRLIKLKSATEGLAIAFGKQLSPTLSAVTDLAIQAANAFTDLFTNPGRAAIKFAVIINSALGSFISSSQIALSELVTRVSSLFSSFSSDIDSFLVEPLKTSAKFLGDLFFELARGIQKGFNFIVLAIPTLISKTFKLLGGEIEDVGILLSGLPGRFGEFGKTIEDAGESIKGFGQSTLNALKPLLEEKLTNITNLQQEFRDAIDDSIPSANDIASALDEYAKALEDAGAEENVFTKNAENLVRILEQMRDVTGVTKTNLEDITASLADVGIPTPGEAPGAEVREAIDLTRPPEGPGVPFAPEGLPFSPLAQAEERREALLAFENKLATERFAIEANLAKRLTAVNQQKDALLLSGAQRLGQGLIASSNLSSKKQFLISQALAVASATVAAFSASTQALAAPPGPPTTIPLAAAVLKVGLLNAAIIAATAFTGGGGGGGGAGGGGGLAGGGGGGAFGGGRGFDPGISPEIERAAPREAGPSIQVFVEGFVGNEAELASALAPILREAQGDGVEFILPTAVT